MSDVIKLNTDVLIDYAARLDAINRRLVSLDNRMNRLYYQVPCTELLELIRADLMTGYSWKLTKCSNYMRVTAAQFEWAEAQLSKCDDILNYPGIRNLVGVFGLPELFSEIIPGGRITIDEVRVGLSRADDYVKEYLEDKWQEFNGAINSVCAYTDELLDDAWSTTKDAISDGWEWLKKVYDENESVQIVCELGLDVLDMGVTLIGICTNPNPLSLALGGYELINGVFKTGSDLVALGAYGIGSTMDFFMDDIDSSDYMDEVNAYRNAEGLADVLRIDGMDNAANVVEKADIVHDLVDAGNSLADLGTGGVDILKAAKDGDAGEFLKSVFDATSGFKAPTSGKNIIVDINKGVKIYQAASEGDFDKAAFSITEPTSLGSDIVELKEKIFVE